MKKPTIVLVAFAALLVLLGATLIPHFSGGALEIARATKVLAKMLSAQNIVGSALSTYYEKHGAYPRSLKDLPAESLKWGDEGTSAGNLDDFRYTSDGERFTMVWERAEFGKVRAKTLFLGGKKGQLYYSEDEMK